MSIRFIGRYRPTGIVHLKPLTVIPTFASQPSISPAGAQMGTTFTGSDPVVRSAKIVSRQWYLNGKAITGQTTNSYVSNGTGNLTFGVTASGPGGTISTTSDPVVISVNPATYNAPTWTTQPGLLGTFAEGSTISVPIQASDADNNIASYLVTSGSLPGGVTLDPSSGMITGTLAQVSVDTSYTFQITVTDSTNLSISGNFTINVANVASTVVWNTDNSAPVANMAPGEPVNTSVGASSS